MDLICHDRLKYCFKNGPKIKHSALVSTTIKDKNECIVYLFKHLKTQTGDNIAK